MPLLLRLALAMLLLAVTTAGVTVAAQTGARPDVTIARDKAMYHVGDPITLCYAIPAGATPVEVIEVLAGGSTRTLLAGVDDGTGGCLTSTVTGPVGTSCARIAVTAPDGRASLGTAQTCFRVLPASGPLPPASTSLSLNLDRAEYRTGERAYVCYAAPRGTVVIAEQYADTPGQTLYAGESLPGCLIWTVSSPAGSACLRLDAFTPDGAPHGVAQRCVRLLPAADAPPSARATLRTERAGYRAGDPVQVCYTVPAAGTVAVTLIRPDATSEVVALLPDNGSGGCLTLVAPAQRGTSCLRLELSTSALLPLATAETCYEVISQ